MSNLISLERAKLSITAAGSGDDRLIENLIAAASRAIERFCHRVFTLASYDELVWVNENVITLSRFPVQSIESVRTGPVVVLSVQNTAMTTNQQARVTITSTGVELVRVASGVKVVNTILFSTYVTLTALADAITAIANGWTATVASGYALYPSADLYVPPMGGDGLRSTGALNARGVACPLYLHVGEASDYQWDYRGFLDLRSIDYSNPIFWPTNLGNDLITGRTARVQYNAGFAEIPPDIQEACAMLVADWFYLAARDPALSNTLDADSVASGYVDPGPLPGRVRGLVSPYRVRSV